MTGYIILAAILAICVYLALDIGSRRLLNKEKTRIKDALLKSHEKHKERFTLTITNADTGEKIMDVERTSAVFAVFADGNNPLDFGTLIAGSGMTLAVLASYSELHLLDALDTDEEKRVVKEALKHLAYVRDNSRFK